MPTDRGDPDAPSPGSDPGFLGRFFRGEPPDRKTALQSLVGFYILAAIPLKLAIYAIPAATLSALMTEGVLRYFTETSILEISGHALGFATAVELAFLMFTPGPDEAIDPFILGVTSTALMVLGSVSGDDAPEMIWNVATTSMVFAVCIMVLFLVRNVLVSRQSGDEYREDPSLLVQLLKRFLRDGGRAGS